MRVADSKSARKTVRFEGGGGGRKEGESVILVTNGKHPR